MMRLKPDKHFNIETSIIILSTILIKELVQNKYIKFDKLYSLFVKQYEEATLEEFIYCLMLLYSIGRIEYYKENDVIGLINYEN
ncbi:ABC-three component system middle component 6 [Clostridium sp. K25]|uniref:ABC-three component system middle component 6 n=1 Tax=Clostridium sp. K25 TaxID=1443109 RepID=UPI00057E8263|nr:ABC-three component system middle component 6 [Clostridium sp. K25]